MFTVHIYFCLCSLWLPVDKGTDKSGIPERVKTAHVEKTVGVPDCKDKQMGKQQQQHSKTTTAGDSKQAYVAKNVKIIKPLK